MTAAALIVVIIGRTQGLAWEVETLARLGLLTKVLWVFPPVDVGELERRWAATLRLLVNEVGPGLTLGAEPGAVLMARVHDNTELVAYIGDRRDEWASDRPPRLARRWRSRSAPTSCSVPTAIGPRLRRAGACSPTSSPTLSSSARGSLPGGSSGRPPGPRRLPPLPFPVSPTRTWVLGVPATNVLRHGGAPPGPVRDVQRDVQPRQPAGVRPELPRDRRPLRVARRGCDRRQRSEDPGDDQQALQRGVQRHRPCHPRHRRCRRPRDARRA